MIRYENDKWVLYDGPRVIGRFEHYVEALEEQKHGKKSWRSNPGRLSSRADQEGQPEVGRRIETITDVTFASGKSVREGSRGAIVRVEPAISSILYVVKMDNINPSRYDTGERAFSKSQFRFIPKNPAMNSARPKRRNGESVVSLRRSPIELMNFRRRLRSGDNSVLKIFYAADPDRDELEKAFKVASATFAEEGQRTMRAQVWLALKEGMTKAGWTGGPSLEEALSGVDLYGWANKDALGSVKADKASVERAKALVLRAVREAFYGRPEKVAEELRHATKLIDRGEFHDDR